MNNTENNQIPTITFDQALAQSGATLDQLEYWKAECIADGIATPLIDAEIEKRKEMLSGSRDVLFGPFPNKPLWEPKPDQYKNLLNDFEQTHEDIRVEFCENVQQGPNVRSGNAITGKRKAVIDQSVLQTCPRRIEDGAGPGSPFVGSEDGDVWGKDRTCSYCGSMHPEDFLAAAKEGKELGPTDKNYKVYIQERKFYFQHLDDMQRREFISLLNEKKLSIGFPGHFYVLPFFVTRGVEGK